MRFLFWDLFGLSELEDLQTEENFIITQYTGELLLGLYSIASILVAINMLIAMMANSYQRVVVSTQVLYSETMLNLFDMKGSLSSGGVRTC